MIYEESGETPGTKRAIAEGGVPDLVGAPDEIEKAREIRVRILVEGDDILGQLRADQIMTESQKDTVVVSPRQVTVEQVHSAEAALHRLRHVSDAAWWIAQEHATAESLLSSLVNQSVETQDRVRDANGR